MTCGYCGNALTFTEAGALFCTCWGPERSINIRWGFGDARDARIKTLEFELKQSLEREDALIHAAWDEGRRAQRAHKTEDFERIRQRAAASKKVQP